MDLSTKADLKNPVLLAAAAAILSIAAGQAQTFHVLHIFPPAPWDSDTNSITYRSNTNSEGTYPNSLVLSGGTLYGTASGGGSGGSGTVFKINADGTGFEVLYTFTPVDRSSAPWVNSDGYNPNGPLVVSGNMLYGTTTMGGPSGSGTVFALNMDGTGFATIYSFTASAGNGVVNSDGARPYAGVVLSGGSLYGTTSRGGDGGFGTVFTINTDGTGFNTLYSFSPPIYYDTPYTNTDGLGAGNLVLSGSTLYGSALGGGTSGCGTVFALSTDGSAFTTLHDFPYFISGNFTNSGGGSPRGLGVSGNTLYGLTDYGGAGGNGTIFKLNVDGTGFALLHVFSGTYMGPNTDGFWLSGCLALSGNSFYGMATAGGIAGSGTLFAVGTDGTGFSVIQSFGRADYTTGYLGIPSGGLIVSSNTLYGATSSGIFSISLDSGPQLTQTTAAGNIILSWPANFTGFTLQSTTNLASAASWAPVSPAPVTVTGLNIATNPISGAQQFYRLSQ